MKIFSNFDTELDVKIFKKRIQRYWEENVLLVKRHPLFLINAFIKVVIVIILLILLVWVIYIEHWKNDIYFFRFLFLHFIGIWIWIFVLLKIFMKLLWNHKEFIKYEKDLKNIDIKWFWNFIKHSIFLFFYQILLSIIWLYSIFSTMILGISNIWLGILQLIINLAFIILIYKIILRFIDFEMDFVIVTIDEIESYAQTWFLKNDITTMDLSKCRSITMWKEWLFNSFFNLWTLNVLSEWDNEHHWEVKFNYIHQLELLKKELLILVHKSKRNIY